MASFFEDKDRRVIPNWRTFKKTLLLGELDGNWRKPLSNRTRLSIADYIHSWQKSKTVAVASDLLSASLSNNLRENIEIYDAAGFILNNPESATISQLQLANTFLRIPQTTKFARKIDAITASHLEDLINPQPIRKKIQILKKSLDHFSFNPVTYVELARLYSILGQKEKALRAMKIAVQFGKHNRFVLRCASRLFAHYDDLEYAHDLLRKSDLAAIDPWVTSAEIALATIRDRGSRFVRNGFEMLKSKNFSLNMISELASSLGTIEMLNGSSKKCKTLFNLSLIKPNDNSLAQAEWASNKDKSLELQLQHIEIDYSFEASAINNFNNEDFERALNDSARWLADMPFSKRPVNLGSHIAGSLMDDQETAIMFIKAGLESHPNDPQLINNMVYYLIMADRVDEAGGYIDLLPQKSGIDGNTDICLNATSGLFFFRTNRPEEGRLLYRKAIEDSKKLNNRYFNWLAILNYAREEILARSEYVDEVINLVRRIPDGLEGSDIDKLKKTVLDLYQSKVIFGLEKK